jgi:transposase
MNTQELVLALKKNGYKLSEIAKFCGVGWSTVYIWEKGVFQAKAKDKLELMLKTKPR